MNLPPVDMSQKPKQECKEEVPTPDSEEQFNVKEVPEDQGEEPFVDGPSSDPMHIPHVQDASHGPLEAPWIWAMSVLCRSRPGVEANQAQ